MRQTENNCKASPLLRWEGVGRVDLCWAERWPVLPAPVCAPGSCLNWRAPCQGPTECADLDRPRPVWVPLARRPSDLLLPAMLPSHLPVLSPKLPSRLAGGQPHALHCSAENRGGRPCRISMAQSGSTRHQRGLPARRWTGKINPPRLGDFPREAEERPRGG